MLLKTVARDNDWDKLVEWNIYHVDQDAGSIDMRWVPYMEGYDHTEYVPSGRSKGIYFIDRGCQHGDRITDGSFCIKPEE